MKQRKKSDLMQQLVFMGPAVIAFAMVVIIPFFMGIYYSLTDWNGVSINLSWVGIKNYLKLFTDSSFLKSIVFTTKYTVVVVILTNVLGFALAYFLTQKLFARNLMRTVFFMPNVLGGILIGFIWKFIFVKGFAAIGQMTDFGFFKLSWLGTSNTAFWALVIVTIWQSAGYLMVIYIAGLTTVPRELQEAAKIDGATEGQILTKIILPLIKPTITICMFYMISHAYKVYELNSSLTEGGPFRSTESVTMNIFNEAFVNTRYGYGSAKAVVLFIIIAVVTVIQQRLATDKDVQL